MRFYESLRGNTIPYEVIFVGNVRPNFPLPANFKHIYTTVKPAQCYEIGFRAATGELIHWTADDADYHCPAHVLPVGQDCFDPLDRAYKLYQDMEARYNHDTKSVVAFRPIEDGGDVYKFHHFFGGWPHTPAMAPFALINREYFVNRLGGYDRRFVSGQSENDVVMRVYEDGGRVEQSMDAFLYVHHRQVHPRDPNTGREDNKFRKWYNTDRDVLEAAWVNGGRGFYEQYNAMKDGPEKESAKRSVPISTKRLQPVERFEDEGLLTQTQGLKGHWQ
jgi:hypothetical protein